MGELETIDQFISSLIRL